VPGTQLKFVPCGDKLEMRVRGPSVFPRYLKDLPAAWRRSTKRASTALATPGAWSTRNGRSWGCSSMGG
jgi:hypothetical protein